ncbi:MAG: CU044_2847 family protein [Cyanobacteria bacterium J06635_1]
MSQPVPITLDDGTVIYIEAADNAPLEAISDEEVTRGGERTRTPKGPVEQIQHHATSIKGTITGYTRYTLDAFRAMGSGNVDKVTLEFGVKVGGTAGIPYITEGTAEANLKITVECSFKE